MDAQYGIEYCNERLAEITQRAVMDGGHLVYQPRQRQAAAGQPQGAASANKDGYIVVSITVPGLTTQKMLLAHAVYTLANCERPGIFELPSDWHISHLCHRPNCISLLETLSRTGTHQQEQTEMFE